MGLSYGGPASNMGAMQVAEREVVDRVEGFETRRLKWTRNEYYQMFELGLFHGRRVELLGGELYEMSPQKGPHAGLVAHVVETLRRAFRTGFVFREHSPLDLGLDSDPEPDVAVVRGSTRDYIKDHPGTAVLVVEVADSSLEHDRKRKSSLYAKAGIQEYWIVNIPERKLEVRRRAAPTPDTPFGHDYADGQILGPAATISTLEVPDVVFKVEEFLP